MMIKYYSFALALAACVACQSEDTSPKQLSEKKTTSSHEKQGTDLKIRTLTDAEKVFVGKWGTQLRDKQGNIVQEPMTVGSYLEFNADGTYALLRNDTPIRQGNWQYSPSDKMLEMQSIKGKKSFFLVEKSSPELLELIEQDKGFRLFYVPYKL